MKFKTIPNIYCRSMCLKCRKRLRSNEKRTVFLLPYAGILRTRIVWFSISTKTRFIRNLKSNVKCPILTVYEWIFVVLRFYLFVYLSTKNGHNTQYTVSLEVSLYRWYVNKWNFFRSRLDKSFQLSIRCQWSQIVSGHRSQIEIIDWNFSPVE